MASLIYDSFLDDLSQGNVKSGDTYYAMVVTSTYAPNKGTHTKRSDVTNEASGTGYTAGGQAVTVTEAKDTGAHKATWTFGTVSWTSATLTGRAIVIYKHRGGLASADELVCYVDNGSDVTSTNGTWSFSFSSALTLQN